MGGRVVLYVVEGHVYACGAAESGADTSYGGCSASGWAEPVVVEHVVPPELPDAGAIAIGGVGRQVHPARNVHADAGGAVESDVVTSYLGQGAAAGDDAYVRVVRGAHPDDVQPSRPVRDDALGEPDDLRLLQSDISDGPKDNEFAVRASLSQPAKLSPKRQMA